MTKNEFLSSIKNVYALVHTIKDTSDYQIYHFRNIEHNKDIIIRTYTNPQTAYEPLCDIQYENLPLIYDIINLDDGQIVLEEFIDGINLAETMECQKFTFKTAKPVIISICNALSVLHKMGFVHRDIKPENIMIDKNGRVVLIDFNAVRKISNASKDTVIMGTVGYASPEQLGLRESDARTDIYALGVLINVMITGKHPSEEIAKGRIGKIVRKCTNVNPDERYQTVAKLIMAL